MTEKQISREERIARKRLRGELEHSAYLKNLVKTVRDVPDDLLVAWAELADCRDVKAFTEWHALLHDRKVNEVRFRYLEGKRDTATFLLRQYVSVMTCGLLPEEVSRPGASVT